MVAELVRTDRPPPQASPPLAARTAGAADGLIADEGAVGQSQRAIVGGTEKEDAGADVDAAAHAVAAIGPGASGAADGLVVNDGGVADGHDRAKCHVDAAAHAGGARPARCRRPRRERRCRRPYSRSRGPKGRAIREMPPPSPTLPALPAAPAPPTA